MTKDKPKGTRPPTAPGAAPTGMSRGRANQQRTKATKRKGKAGKTRKGR